jgi:signal transduction histidine kinase
MHQDLVEASRQAGMAEVASNVLHNVGNVLNSVNVSASLAADHIRKSSVPHLSQVGALLEQNSANIGEYMANDPIGRKVPGFLCQLATQLDAEQKLILKELDQLAKNVEHIKDIVAVQQSYATSAGVSQKVEVIELVEDSLRMNAGALTRHDVQLHREYETSPVIFVDKHKVVQILVNLIRNAKYACDDSGKMDKRLKVRVDNDERTVRVSVIDNGVGIPPENLTRIFSHGFTTRKNGHGFGLHSGALAAREVGGALLAHSDGEGRGATFTLELPFESSSNHEI